MDWRLSHLDWEGWGGGKKIAPWNHSEISSTQVITKWQWDIIYSKVTQGVAKALGITYYLHCAWRSQSSGKVDRANQFLKSVIKKITQETSLRWKEVLPKLSSTPVLPLRNRLVLVHRRCYMGDLLFISMTSSWIQKLRPSGLIPWPLGNSNKIYACVVSTRTQKILKSHHYMLQGLKS